MLRQRRLHQSAGFSVLLLSLWLIGLGVAVALVLALLPNRADELRLDRTISTLKNAQDGILAFVVENYRLPVPDTDAPAAATFGLENAGATSGALPYRSMGLPTDVRDQASVLLRYAPYRNAGANADLAAATSLYVPALPTAADYGCSAIPASPVNLLDFCVALDNAVAAAASSTYANTGPGTINAAYVLLSGGLEDADGDGADRTLDGANDDGDLSFEDPARGREKGYDDLVRPLRAESLRRELSCGALVGSLELLVETAEDSKILADNTQVQKFQADVGAALDAFGVIMAGIAVANAAAAEAGAIATEAEICGLAAACLGLCVNLDAACVAATAALVSATAAVAASIVDLVTNVITTAISISIAVGVADLNTAARQHVCDIIDEVVAADQRGGLQ
ncbi:MAG: hypothetical protein LJE84_09565 [Gammaproteobacteria bacterium]|nr:hypothetical protein [Gammaproteobacteria bacterium]